MERATGLFIFRRFISDRSRRIVIHAALSSRPIVFALISHGEKVHAAFGAALRKQRDRDMLRERYKRARLKISRKSETIFHRVRVVARGLRNAARITIRDFGRIKCFISKEMTNYDYSRKTRKRIN